MAVTCSQFVAALSAAPRAAVLDPNMREHAARCSHCQTVWKADELLRATPAPIVAVALPEALKRALRAHRGTTRMSSPWLRALAVSTTCAASLIAAIVLVPRPDLQSAFQARVLPSLVAFAGLMAVSLMSFLYRGQSGLGPAPWLRWFSVGLTFAAFHAVCAVEAAAGTAATSTPLHTPNDCLALGLLTASCILGVTFSVSRHSTLVASRAAGALAGASAGLGALLMLQLHCPSQLGLHLHVVHFLPLALSVVLGVVAGRRWLAA